MSLTHCIEKLILKQDLDFATCQNALNDILSDQVPALQTAAFLVLLRAKGETPDELAAFVNLLQQKMRPVTVPFKVLDIVGTGGDGLNTINLSTASAILAASCGIKVVKHGNRAVSSLTGSADVLSALGVEINLSPEKIAASVAEVGIGFCFSPHFHPAMQTLRQLRKELRVPTTFNLLGPLLNPAKPAHHLLGVYHENLLDLMANTLRQIGTERSFVVHSNGLDEVSCLGETILIDIQQNTVRRSTLTPEQFGLARCQLADLRGGDAKTNAEQVRAIFSAKNIDNTRAMADSMILNAGIALMLYGKYGSIAEGISHAKQNLYDGSAALLLNNWIEFSHD